MSGSNPFFILAPLQGLTGRVFRDAFFGSFSGVSAALTPFISTPPKFSLNKFDKRELGTPEVYSVVPQVLSNSAADILKCAEILSSYGFSEVNLNLGCPVAQIVSKRRGSALLAFPDELDRLFDSVFSDIKINFSIKMRVGFESYDDFDALLPVVARYPFASVTIHPRLRSQFYAGDISFDLFNAAADVLKCPVIYNGSIDSLNSFNEISAKVNTNIFMVGRGVLQNPLLCEEIFSGKAFDEAVRFERIKEFLSKFFDAASLFADAPFYSVGLFKELFSYIKESFPDGDETYRKILPLRSIDEIRKIILL